MKEFQFGSSNIKKVASNQSILTGLSDESSKKYNKITTGVRTSFLGLIINENCSIKKAAEALNINYSSAKSIISNFRKDHSETFRSKQSPGSRQAGIRETHSQESNGGSLTISTSIGGSFVSQQEMVLRCKHIKKHKIFHIIAPIRESEL